MAMIRQHPAPGVDMLPPGIQAKGRVPRAGMAALVSAYFPMPQNPVTGTNALMKSIAQVSGTPTSVGPSHVQMHGIGNYYDGISGMGTLDTSQYAVYALGALVIGYLMFGHKHHGKKSAPPADSAAPAA